MNLANKLSQTVSNKINAVGGNLIKDVVDKLGFSGPEPSGTPQKIIEKDPFLDPSKVLMYPPNIGSDSNGHYIQFFIRNKKDVKFELKGNTLTSSNIIRKTTKSGDKSVTTTEIDPKDTANHKYETPEDDVKIGIINKAGSQRIGTSIALYMPTSITNELAASYEEKATRITPQAAGALGAAAAFKSGNGGAASGAMASMVSGMYEDEMKKQIPHLFEMMGARHGIAYNDRTQIFFKGMGKRAFSFTFKFLPKSEKESLVVDDIVRTFRFFAAASYAGADDVLDIEEDMKAVGKELAKQKPKEEKKKGEKKKGSGERGKSGGWVMLKEPQTFEIVYMYKDKRNEFLNRISYCVLESVKVTQNAEQSKFFHPAAGEKKNGSPAPLQTEMVLAFKEQEIITKDKIQKGY